MTKIVISKLFSAAMCSDGLYGEHCNLACSPNCLDGYCSKSDGSCKCKTGHYGLDCNNICINCNNNSCDSLTGYCTKGCIQGFFGRSCQMTCPVNCLNQCDRDSGNCTQGCVRGFHGNICDQTRIVFKKDKATQHVI